MFKKIGKHPPLKLKSATCVYSISSCCEFNNLLCTVSAMKCYTGFSLNGGCFGTDIIQIFTKWSNVGVHGLSYGPFVTKLHCASFLIRKHQENWQYCKTKPRKNDVREKKNEKLHASHRSWKKQMFRYNSLKFDWFNYL